MPAVDPRIWGPPYLMSRDRGAWERNRAICAAIVPRRVGTSLLQGDMSRQ